MKLAMPLETETATTSMADTDCGNGRMATFPERFPLQLFSEIGFGRQILVEGRRLTMPLETEATTYRREVGRLLAEGHAGRHALIKGEEVISIWDTQRDALQAGRDKFGLDDIAVVRIDERDPERFRLIDSRKASTSCQV
jgi:hypothetical protein